MKTYGELTDWVSGAALDFGDPSVPVCQLFFRWKEACIAPPAANDELTATNIDGDLNLILANDFTVPIAIARDLKPVILGDMGLVEYGAEKIAPGVWAISPSLNLPKLLHAFVVIYDVPDPAPWERLIQVVTG